MSASIASLLAIALGLVKAAREGGPLDPASVVRLGRELADALGAIHAVGVVHRDVKPANVMMVDGEPVLIDFGIAHVADEARITHTGLVMCTPGYLSPEVCTGDPVTPYHWAQALAGELATAVLLTRVGDGHTAYRSSACIRTAVDRYLISLATPPPGTRCPSQ